MMASAQARMQAAASTSGRGQAACRPAPRAGARRPAHVVKAGSRTANREVEAARQSLAASLAAPLSAPAAAQVAGLRTANPDSSGATPAPPRPNLSQGWQPMPHHPDKEALWQAIRTEAKRDADGEPTLASFLYSSVLVHTSFEKALAFVLANKLASPTLFSTQLMKIAQDAYAEDPDIIAAAVADLLAVRDRDPACADYTQPLLYFKGYQAIQCHRIGHHLWRKGRKALALALQSRISEAFHVDIHPAAVFGRGVLLDHATGVVIGETAVVGDNVSMLHHVTLGGSGTGCGLRHPTIGHGALLGAGVSVLGSITVGAGTKVGAGSVVVSDLPCHSVAVGVPARVIKRDVAREPSADMDQISDFVLDFVI